VSSTWKWKCGSACSRRSPNRSGNETFETVVGRVVSRRSLLKDGALAALVLATGCTVGQSAPAAPTTPPAPDPLAFTPIQPGLDDDVIVPQGTATPCCSSGASRS
jgi:secreted PhoX family phosphatase